MRNSILILICLMSCPWIAAADDVPEWIRALEYKAGPYVKFVVDSKRPTLLGAEETNIQRRRYDVLDYEINVDWCGIFDSLDAGSMDLWFDGVLKAVVCIDSAEVDSLVFDAKSLTINDVLVNDQQCNFEQIDNMELQINLNETANTGDTLNIEIAYRYKFMAQNTGLSIYPEGYKVETGPAPLYEEVTIEENLIFTFAEPEQASMWFPCNDRPYDKARATLKVRVPDDYTVACTGILVENTDQLQDGTITSVWRNDFPVSTYLIAANASKYYHWQDWYKRVTNPNDSVPIDYYTWINDYLETSTTGRTHNARDAFRDMVEMMEVLSDKICEYPFERYGNVAIGPISFSGMEHQTLTSLNRSVLRRYASWGDNDKSNQMVIAHELGHQWFGDAITCATWNDIWINEGGAVWTEMLWASRLGEANYEHEYYSKRIRYLGPHGSNAGLRRHAIYDAPSVSLFDFAITYCKSSMIYNMMYQMIGHDEFKAILQKLFAEHKGTSMETWQIRDFMKQEYPDPSVPWDVFFDQWIFHRGHPVFDVNYYSTEQDGNYKLKIKLDQVQSELVSLDIPEVFQVPLGFRIEGEDNEQYERVVMNKKMQEYEITLPFKPDTVIIDELLTLCEVRTANISVSERAQVSAEPVYPNPVRAGQLCVVPVASDKPRLINAEVFDIMGRSRGIVLSGYLLEGQAEINVPTRRLEQGVYSVMISDGEHSESRMFSVVK